MSRFPDPRAPDPRLDQLRQRTGQQQGQPSQYPQQDFSAPQQLWPRDEAPPQNPYPQAPQQSGYANGQQGYGAPQGYNGNGYGAPDPYAQGYGAQAPAEAAYPYANGGYPQQPQQPSPRALPAPQAPSHQMPAQQGQYAPPAQQQARPLSQQAGFGYPAQPAPQPQQARPAARQVAPVQPASAQPFSTYAPPSVGQHLPPQHTPSTAGRRAPEGASSGYGLQPRQDAQVGLGAWQQPQQQATQAAAPQTSQAYGAPQARPHTQQPQQSAPPQSDMYGLSQGFQQPAQGFGQSSQGYGAVSAPASQPYSAERAPAAPSPQQSLSSFNGGYQQPSQGGFPQPQPQAWRGAEDLGRLPQQAPPAHDFGFEPPIDSLGDSFATRDGLAAQTHATSFDQSYADDEVDYEVEGGGRSWKKVAFLLGLFVSVGGSLALAYSMLLGSPSATQTAATPPVIKGDERPTKVKPSEPGGKQFGYTDSKVLGRVGEGGPQAASGSSSGSGDVDPVTGARKVPLLTVGRDGTIQSPPVHESAPSQQAAAVPAVPGQTSETRAVVVVPGMTVIDGIGQRPLGGSAGAPTTTASTSPPPQQQQPAQQQVSQPQSPKIITASEPQQKPVVVAPPAPEKKPPAQPKKTTVAAADVGAGSTLAAPATSATAQPSPSVTGAGFVTVLASVPATGSSRDVAMRQFQDMQQKYASVLTGKVADVVEANLGDKGTYHRLIAGPPGSKESANQLCNDLKAQGYAGCWVTAY